MNEPQKPGAVTVLLQSPFDPRRYASQAWHMLEKAPAQALRVGVLLISYAKNSKEGWLLLFLSSIALWNKLPAWKKGWRKITAFSGIPKSQIKVPIFISDHAGITTVWEELLVQFAGDEVMEELIRTFVHRIDPSAKNSMALAKFLSLKASEMKALGGERSQTFAHAIALAQKAVDLEPLNGEYTKLLRDIFAQATMCTWEEVASGGGSYLDVLAQGISQPSLNPQKP